MICLVNANPEQLREQFAWIQIGLLALLVYFTVRFLKRQDAGSQFKPGSASKPPRRARPRNPSREKLQALLSGFSFTGQPHEILGVRESATELEIRRAHRQLIKRFHPDVVGSPDSREWHEAQKIAETLNRARDVMLEKLRS